MDDAFSAEMPFSPHGDFQSETIVPSSPEYFQDLPGGYWVVSRYADVRHVLTDTAHFSSRQVLFERAGASGKENGRIPFGLDPPYHNEYRRVLARLIDARMKGVSSGLAQAAVAEALTASVHDDFTTFAEHFVAQAVTIAMFRFIGFPPGDELYFTGHAEVYLRNRLPAHSLIAEDRNDHSPAAVANAELGAYVSDQVGCRRGILAGGLLDMLMACRWQNRFAPHEDEAANIILTLLRAALASTYGMMLDAAACIARCPVDRKTVLEQNSLVPLMAEELLRLYSPFCPVRTLRRDTTVAGVELVVGEQVLMHIYAANRDPAVFTRPGEMVLHRSGRAHLAFGAGPHWCLGAALVRDLLAAALPILAVQAEEKMRGRRAT